MDVPGLGQIPNPTRPMHHQLFPRPSQALPPHAVAAGTGPRQREVVAIERANPGVIKRIVVQPAEAFPTDVVPKKPFLESVLYALLLFPGRLGGLSVHSGFLVCIVVIDRGRLKIEGIFDQLDGGTPVGPPVGGVRGRKAHSPVSIQEPGAKGRNGPGDEQSVCA